MSTAGTVDDIAVDVGRLEALLRSDGADVTGPLRATRVGRGQSNLTYVVEDAGGARWIVRRPPRGHLLDSAHDVLRESGILSALRQTAVPVPAIIAEYDDPSLAETPVVVMEHVTGQVVDDMRQAESMTLDARRGLGVSLAEALSTIHHIDLDGAGLAGLASHAPYAARQLKRWSRQWKATATQDLPALDHMTDLLTRHIPEQREVALVHGDFHMRNVIVDPDTGSLRAVLDWELSTLGDPLADVGSMLAYWTEAGDPPTGLFAASNLPGFLTRQQLADAYLSASGRDAADLAYWHVLGIWKVAVISDGVRRRAIDDPRNAAEGGPPAASLTANLVKHAWATARAAGLDT